MAFAYYGNPLRGFLSSISVVSIVVVIVTLYDMKYYLSLWAIISLDIFVHYYILREIRTTDSHFPGVIFTPLVIVDTVIWQYIAVTVIRWTKI